MPLYIPENYTNILGTVQNTEKAVKSVKDMFQDNLSAQLALLRVTAPMGQAIKIEGFDLSNSPLEYTEDIVKDKTVIMSTTNGTRTLTECSCAKRVFVGSMLNGKAVAEKLVELGEDVVIVNSGTNGQFSMDDFICSGYIINEMLKISNKLYLSDIAKTANYVYENNTDIESFIKDARHYGVMKNLNLMKDIEYCMQKNITNIVPEYKDGHIIE